MRLTTEPKKIGIIVFDQNGRPLENETTQLRETQGLQVDQLGPAFGFRPVFQVKYRGELVQNKMAVAKFTTLKDGREIHTVHWTLPFRYILTFCPDANVSVQFGSLRNKNSLIGRWSLRVSLGLVENSTLIALPVSRRAAFLRTQVYVPTSTLEWRFLPERSTDRTGSLTQQRDSASTDFEQAFAVSFEDL